MISVNYLKCMKNTFATFNEFSNILNILNISALKDVVDKADDVTDISNYLIDQTVAFYIMLVIFVLCWMN